MWKDCICEKFCCYTVFSLEWMKNQLPESQKSKNIGDEGSFDRVSRSTFTTGNPDKIPTVFLFFAPNFRNGFRRAQKELAAHMGGGSIQMLANFGAISL